MKCPSETVLKLLGERKNLDMHILAREISSEKAYELKPSYFVGWGYLQFNVKNAIESPSFDVINGTTRVSDPLWSPNLRSSL